MLAQRSCQVSNHKDSATLLTRHNIVCFVGGFENELLRLMVHGVMPKRVRKSVVLF
jgi:hypothetical protein